MAPQEPQRHKVSLREATEWLRAILLSETTKQLKDWCKATLATAYTMNITHHRAINETPYEAVFGFKAHREHQNNPREKDELPNPKWQKRIESQSQYHEKMIKQTTSQRNINSIDE